MLLQSSNGTHTTGQGKKKQSTKIKNWTSRLAFIFFFAPTAKHNIRGLEHIHIETKKIKKSDNYDVRSFVSTAPSDGTAFIMSDTVRRAAGSTVLERGVSRLRTARSWQRGGGVAPDEDNDDGLMALAQRCRITGDPAAR